MKTKYKFSHRAGGRYYWKARVPHAPAYEDTISCPVGWFWNWITDDTSLPHCDCEGGGSFGATGMMPDGGHCLVVTPKRQYLAHRAAN